MVESVLWDDWHVVAEAEQLFRSGAYTTRLFDHPVIVSRDSADMLIAMAEERPVAIQLKHGFVWVCLGTPERDIPDFPECHESNRWIVTSGSIGVAVSGLRVVENFLDLGHLAFVHANILGEESHAGIRPYRVEIRPDGIQATECVVYQPVASPVATTGFDVDYDYAVLRPYTVLLHKSNPAQVSCRDLIVLFLQPVTQDSCVAHLLTVYLKDGIDEAGVRRFGQMIFGQDKPILENQIPKRLPLGGHDEVSIRADASSAAYRRWLRDNDIRYGAIPASGRR